jgi:hypothetical protein
LPEEEATTKAIEAAPTLTDRPHLRAFTELFLDITVPLLFRNDAKPETQTRKHCHKQCGLFTASIIRSLIARRRDLENPVIKLIQYHLYPLSRNIFMVVKAL